MNALTDFPSDDGNGVDPRSAARRRLAAGAGAVLALALVAVLVWWLKSLVGAPPSAARQVARVVLLPDTPPPPPPPQTPPEPRDAPKPAPRAEAPKPDAPKPPADAPLKMEGAAGDAPSAFQAGTVTEEYKGGPVTVGGEGGGQTLANRTEQRLYAATARQLLRNELEQRLGQSSSPLVAEFRLWVAGDGALARYEIVPSGDAERDRTLDAALAQAQERLHLPPPPALEQPLRFRLTLRTEG